MLDTARRLILALLFACVGVVLTQLPAQACSCKAATVQTHTKEADALFSGKVTRVSGAGKNSTATFMRYVVEVDRVYKGDITTSTVTVKSPKSATSCGLGELTSDSRYLFFVNINGANLRATSCGGTAPATPKLTRQVERLLGVGTPPTLPQPEKAVFTSVAADANDDLPRLAAPGVALVLIGLLGLIVVRRFNARG